MIKNGYIYFQKEKNSLKIDSVLLTKDKWDCNCYRDDGHLDWIKQWIYDIPDSTKENIDKDYIRFDQVGHGFASIITYYTTDTNKSTFIISEMKNRNLSELTVCSFASFFPFLLSFLLSPEPFQS